MSPGGLTGVETPSGGVLALTPHPERVVVLESKSWYPPEMKKTWGGPLVSAVSERSTVVWLRPEINLLYRNMDEAYVRKLKYPIFLKSERLLNLRYLTANQSP